MRISFPALVTLMAAMALAAPAPAAGHLYRHPAHRRAVHPLATAQIPASTSLAALPMFGARLAGPVAPEEPDAWEGLGRNPDDCARFNCVDNN